MKIISAFFIIISSAFLGWYIDRIKLLRIEDLEGIRRVLYMVYAEVEYSSNSFPAAVEEIMKKNNTRVNYILEELLKLLDTNKGYSISKLWDEAIDKGLDKTYFIKEDVVILKSFGKSLGYLDKEMQKKNIKLTLGYIEEKIELLTKAYEKNGRLYRSLGILAGCLIWILLI